MTRCLEAALLVIQIMPVKYSIVKDQTSSVLNLKTSKITFPIQIPEKSPSASSLFVLVGLGRFELPTSPLSGVRSNQLSYRPLTSGFFPIPGGGRIESGRFESWWSWSGSNRRPPECKSGALPAELQPLLPLRTARSRPSESPLVFVSGDPFPNPGKKI